MGSTPPFGRLDYEVEEDVPFLNQEFPEVEEGVFTVAAAIEDEEEEEEEEGEEETATESFPSFEGEETNVVQEPERRLFTAQTISMSTRGSAQSVTMRGRSASIHSGEDERAFTQLSLSGRSTPTTVIGPSRASSPSAPPTSTSTSFFVQAAPQAARAEEGAVRRPSGPRPLPPRPTGMSFPNLFADPHTGGPSSTATRQAPRPDNMGHPQQPPSPHTPSGQSPLNGQNGFSPANGAGGMGGMSGVGGQGGPGPMSMFPTSAGHQMDLNHLWGQVQELSSVLERNRETTAGIVRRVGELRARARAGGNTGLEGLLRGLVVPGDGEAGEAGEEPNVHTRLQEVERHNAWLESENADLTDLVRTYEDAVAQIMDKIRNYAHNHTMSNLAVQRSYSEQLAAERATNLELRQEMIDMRGRLGGVAGMLREAIRWEEGAGDGVTVAGDGGLRDVEAFAAIRNENRVLRGLVGLPVEDDEDDEQRNRPEIH